MSQDERLRFLLALLISAASVAAEITEEQRLIPLEAEAPDPKLARIILLAGSPSNNPGQHEYFAGAALIRNWLTRIPGVWPVMCANGWPTNDNILAGAATVIVYADGGAKLPFLEGKRWERMRQVVSSGTGLVMLHQAVDVPETHADELQGWLGGVWTKDNGCRGHWDMTFSDFPAHPILHGVTAFAAPLDGWLYNLHFAPGAVPLIRGTVPDSSRSTADARAHTGREETVAWAYTRQNGGRSFAFTGCDLHKNWAVESQRRLVINGILWSAGVEIPAEGASVPLAPQDLARNLDDKPKAKKAAAPPPP